MHQKLFTPSRSQREAMWRRFKYHTTFAEFRRAVQTVLNNIAAYADELASLMTERFQLFTAA